MNAVTKKTKEVAPSLLSEAGLRVEISEISVARRLFGQNGSLKLNPINIIVGIKWQEDFLW